MTIAILISLITFLALYLFLVPKSQRRITPDKKSVANTNPMLRFMTGLSNELYAAMPAAFVSANPNLKRADRVEQLLIQSGNPWGVKPAEFTAYKYVTAFVGVVGGIATWFLIKDVVTIPWWVVVPAAGLLGFIWPESYHKDIVKKRDLDFKRQLPDALDLIVISLAGGSTFAKAVRDSIPNMEEGTLKEEFKTLVKTLDTGRTMDTALDDFAKRAPNESVATFIRSVQSANEVDAPLTETLEARAEASRQEFFALVNEKAAALQTTIWLPLTATFLPAVMIVVVAPSMSMLVEMMG
jgi:tight adherence protein C